MGTDFIDVEMQLLKEENARLEKQLAEDRRLEAIGQLAGGESVTFCWTRVAASRTST